MEEIDHISENQLSQVQEESDRKGDQFLFILKFSFLDQILQLRWHMTGILFLFQKRYPLIPLTPLHPYSLEFPIKNDHMSKISGRK